jgi:NitT/TauT family transport system substrate-binding protein
MRTRPKTSRWLIVTVTCLSLVAAACGDDDDDAGDEPAAATEAPAPDSTDAAPATTEEADAPEPDELRSVDLALSTTSGFGYGYHIAKNLGFYEAEGLDVALQGTGGSSDVAQILAVGNAAAGMGVPGAMLPAIEQGAALYPFFTYAYGEVFDVVVPTDSEAETIEDLRGLTIGISALGGGEVPLVRALLSEAGIDPDTDVEILAVGADAPTVRLAFDRGDIDAYSSAKSDIAAMSAVGLDLRSVAPDSLDTLPAEGLLATEDTKDDDELLIGLARATAKGQLIAYANEDAAVCVLKQEIPEEFTNEEAGRESLTAVIDITRAPQNEDGTYVFGFLDAEGWNTYVEIFVQGEILSEAFDMTPYVINDLLESYNDFDQQAIIDMANSLPTDC